MIIEYRWLLLDLLNQELCRASDVLDMSVNDVEVSERSDMTLLSMQDSSNWIVDITDGCC